MTAPREAGSYQEHERYWGWWTNERIIEAKSESEDLRPALARVIKEELTHVAESGVLDNYIIR